MELFSVVILCSATDSAFNHFHQTLQGKTLNLI